jgi:hypothetical protein
VFLLADERHQPPGREETDRVQDDGERRCHDPDQPTADGRAGDLCGRSGNLQLGVALNQVLAVEERGQVGLVCDVEEDRE